MLVPAVLLVTLAIPSLHAADTAQQTEWQLPNENSRLSFASDTPIVFIDQGRNAAEWDQLAAFWNESTESDIDPRTGLPVTRKVIKIKVPLGLSAPPIPIENPPTIAKWVLGKRLFFDGVLSSDGTVACSSCHAPEKGFSDQLKVSHGIGGQLGGINAPSIINSAFNARQFWDGRAMSLEEQAQGPVENPLEMSTEATNSAWVEAIGRIRQIDGYAKQFPLAFGSPPTRDTVAKAIATFERTVLSGNSIADRAEVAMRARTVGGRAEPTARDYASVLSAAVARGDGAALKPLDLPESDNDALDQAAERLARGRALFFGKARCNGCHGGENFTDNRFHNLGIGVTDGELPETVLGRFGSLPTGHKNPRLMGAFKTPTLRGLLDTAPYMHDGSLVSLEEVVDFYDRGGNANAFLDEKLRDYDAEIQFEQTRAAGRKYQGSGVKLLGPNQKPIAPLKLNLSVPEKRDLVLFLRALQGDPVDRVVSDRILYIEGEAVEHTGPSGARSVSFRAGFPPFR
jgi:cytochrome c peroxidase